MAKSRSLTIEQFFQDNEENLGLRWISGKKGGQRLIREGSVSRPGLALTGFFDYFPEKRIQIMGMAETSYLESLDEGKREESMFRFMEEDFPCMIYARNLVPGSRVLRMSNDRSIPVFISPLVTYNVANAVTIYLEYELAMSVLVSGGLVDIEGMGVFIRGESGSGKSECILSLLRRGHALVSDDTVNVKRISGGGRLVGTAGREELMGYLEIRGLGPINIVRLFGAQSFRHEKDIDLVMTLKPWEDVGYIDRSGLEHENYRILGVDLPHVTIPVAPGRETVNLVEVAAQEFRMRGFGVHSGKELDEAIVRSMRGFPAS